MAVKGLKEDICQLWVLSRAGLNFCVGSAPLQESEINRKKSVQKTIKVV